MRALPHVFERPERVIRSAASCRDRRSPARPSLVSTAGKAGSSKMGPRDVVIQQAIAAHFLQLSETTQGRATMLNNKWIVRMSAARTVALETRIAPRLWRPRGNVLGFQAIRFIQKRSNRRDWDSIRPVPETPGSCHGELRAHCLLPAAGSDGVCSRPECRAERQDQRPGNRS